MEIGRDADTCSEQLPMEMKEDADRLSSLPDAILYHILSFLPDQRDSLNTRLLSKYFLCLWTNSPDLHLHFNNADAPHFVTKTLCRRDKQSHLRSFRIHTARAKNAELESWTAMASFFNIQNLDISVTTAIPADNPSFLDVVFLESPSLRSLRLKFGYGLRLPEKFNLGNLRILHLDQWRITDGYMGKLFSACPLIEDLSLTTCKTSGNLLDISAPNLRMLRLCNTPWHSRAELSIACPRLVFFSLTVCSSLHHFQGDMPSLTRAEISLQEFCDSEHQYRAQFIGQVLRSLCNVTELTFHRAAPKLCTRQLCYKHLHFNLPSLHNLRSLNLDACFHVCNIEGLINLLRLTPNLNFLKISFQRNCVSCCDKFSCWKPRDQPTSFLKELKEVVLDNSALEITEIEESDTSSFNAKSFLDENILSVVALLGMTESKAERLINNMTNFIKLLPANVKGWEKTKDKYMKYRKDMDYIFSVNMLED